MEVYLVLIEVSFVFIGSFSVLFCVFLLLLFLVLYTFHLSVYGLSNIVLTLTLAKKILKFT